MVGIVFALGFVDVPDVEVAGIGVCDVESGDRGIGIMAPFSVRVIPIREKSNALSQSKKREWSGREG